MTDRAIAPVLLTIDEVSARIGISKATLYTWRSGYPHRGPRAIKIGTGMLRYRVTDVELWLHAQRDRDL